MHIKGSGALVECHGCTFQVTGQPKAATYISKHGGPSQLPERALSYGKGVPGCIGNLDVGGSATSRVYSSYICGPVHDMCDTLEGMFIHG